MFKRPPKESKAIPIVPPPPPDAIPPPPTTPNIYARPFVPQAYLDINLQPGTAFLPTPPRKTIDFAAYVNHAFGPAVLSLPPPSELVLPPPFSPTGVVPALGPHTYKPYLDHNLKCEADAQRRNTEASYLYGHDVTLHPDPAWSQTIEALCSLQVPGLRENTPFVEEEDVIELRQLIYQNVDDGSSPEYSQLHGWTHIIYHARVANVIRASETILLRVRGLSGPGRFNVKFQVQDERPLPMLLAVQNAHQAISTGGWLYSMLFPSNHDCDIQEQLHPGSFAQEFRDQQLNWEQKKAVESILSRSYGTLPCMCTEPRPETPLCG